MLNFINIKDKNIKYNQNNINYKIMLKIFMIKIINIIQMINNIIINNKINYNINVKIVILLKKMINY